MNIYINVEIAARELASKLFLGYLAAQKGHNVLIADLATFKRLLKRNALPAGLFHDKAVTPHAGRLSLYKELKNRGFFITSQDEEHGLLSDSYQSFARGRFSLEALEYVDKVFCWGLHDFEALRHIYPQQSEKFQLSGSPRTDFWAGRVEEVSDVGQFTTGKDFVLFSSNLAINAPELHWEAMARINAMGYFERDPKSRYNMLSARGEQFLLQARIAPILESVAESLPDLDVIVRPHPIEDENAWRTVLNKLPNLKVVKEGAIGPWVQRARAVIHNGCTTAFEATLAGTPVLTLRPLKDLQHEREVPNRLGITVSSSAEIADFLNKKCLNENDHTAGKLADDLTNLSDRFHIDSKELAAEKIVGAWDALAGKRYLSHNLGWFASTTTVAFLKARALAAKFRPKDGLLKHGKPDRRAIEKFRPLRQPEVERQLKIFEKHHRGKRVFYKVISPRAVVLKCKT